MPNTVRIAAQVTGAKGAASELDQLKDKFTKLEKQGAKGFAIGAGVAVAQAGLRALGSVVGDVTGFLQDSVTAYRNVEEGQARLTASLRENIAGWNGSTVATDGAIKSAEDLGFTYANTADSLALLVGATHDVSAAIRILGVAENYARFKNEDLLQAATDLTKVEGGSTRALKALGINLHTGATEAERMGAIMQVVGGQAAAFAGTDLGKVSVAEEHMNEAQAKLGKELSHLGAEVLPVLADALGFIVDGLQSAGDEARIILSPIGTLADAFRSLTTNADSSQRPLRDMAALMPPIARSMTETGSGAKILGDHLQSLSKTGGAAVKNDLEPPLRNIKKILSDAATAAGDLDSALGLLTGTIGQTSVKQGELAQAQIDLQDLIAQGPDSKRPGAWTAWQGKIAAANQNILDLHGQISALTGQDDMARFLKQVGAQLDLTNPKIWTMYQNLLNAASAAGALKSNLTGQIGFRTVGSGDRGGTPTPVTRPQGRGTGAVGVKPYVPVPPQIQPKSGKAWGGPVMAGQEYTVGELGPEKFRPDTNGTIIPHGQTGGNTYIVNVSGDLRARDANEVLATMRRLQAIAT